MGTGAVSGDYIIERTKCPCGAWGIELDHTLALKVAARQGIRQYVRALLPDNLRWLCHACHATKTREDRVKMSLLDGRVVKQPLLYPSEKLI